MQSGVKEGSGSCNGFKGGIETCNVVALALHDHGSRSTLFMCKVKASCIMSSGINALWDFVMFVFSGPLVFNNG